MANLSITTICNKKCAYCFANDSRNESGDAIFDHEIFSQALDYLERSGLKQVRLLGGEPTLHPDFTSFVTRALDRGFDIMLFTNGLMHESVLDFLNSLPQNRLTILLNTVHPGEKDTRGITRQKQVMGKLGPVIIPGLNIYRSNLDLDYLLDYIIRYDLRKEIRMGLAHPVLSRKNIFLHPKEYKKIGYEIALFKMKVKQYGILLGFDCGFVPCMFPDEYFELLSAELKKAGTCCHPIIDLLADGSFIACYPLNNLMRIKINSLMVAEELVKDFNTAISPYKEIGIYPYCTSCPLFGNRCNGGCMSFRVQRYYNCRSIA